MTKFAAGALAHVLPPRAQKIRSYNHLPPNNYYICRIRYNRSSYRYDHETGSYMFDADNSLVPASAVMLLPISQVEIKTIYLYMCRHPVSPKRNGRARESDVFRASVCNGRAPTAEVVEALNGVQDVLLDGNGHRQVVTPAQCQAFDTYMRTVRPVFDEHGMLYDADRRIQFHEEDFGTFADAAVDGIQRAWAPAKLRRKGYCWKDFHEVNSDPDTLDVPLDFDYSFDDIKGP